MIRTDYHTRLLAPKTRSEVVNELCLLVTHKFKGEFGIICTGVSGMIGGMVADRLHKPIMIVRKEGDKCHSAYVVEHDLKIRRWVFIDDMTEEGKTMRRVLRLMRENDCGECLAAIMYTGLTNSKRIGGVRIIPLATEINFSEI